MRVRSAVLSLTLAGWLLGCGSSGYGSGSGAATTIAGRYGGSSAKPTGVASTVAAVTTVRDRYGTPSASTAAPAPGVAGAAGLALGDTSLGKVLVDGAGRTLYIFTNDTPGKPSVCVEGCAATWPPLVADQLPAVPAGLVAAKLTVVARADGAKQVAYAGKPLYRYAKDAKAGDTSGENVGGVWFVIDAAGNAVKG